MIKLYRIPFLLVVLTAVGTLGFQLVEGWGFIDSLYMTIITLTTVGYKEIHPLSPAGQLFVIGFLVLGLGVFLYGIVQLGEMVVRTELRVWLGRRKMENVLRSLRDHFVVCGFGRMGESVCRQLAASSLPFVVIEREGDRLDACREEGWQWLAGDATDDRILLAAGLERARGLATALGSDADNLYVVLSARLLSPRLQILARASDPHDGEKMRKAGADGVISPYQAGAVKMFQLLTNPHVENFIEVVTTAGTEMDLAEVTVDESSPHAERLLSDTDFSARGVIVVGIQRKDGTLLMPPPGSARIRPGDLLVVLGRAESVRELIESGPGPS